MIFIDAFLLNISLLLFEIDNFHHLRWADNNFIFGAELNS